MAGVQCLFELWKWKKRVNDMCFVFAVSANGCHHKTSKLCGTHIVLGAHECKPKITRYKKNTMNKERCRKVQNRTIFQGRGDPWALYKFPASPQTWIATSCDQLPFVQLMQKRKTWIRTIRPITLWGQKRVKLNHCIQSQNSCKPAFGPRHFPQMSKDTAPTHFFDVFSDSTT